MYSPFTSGTMASRSSETYQADQTNRPSVSVTHEIFVMLPGPGRGFKGLDKHDTAIAAMLDQVACHHQVYIVVIDGARFKMHTKNMIAGRDAVNTIFDYLKIKPAEMGPVGTYVLLAPPSMGPELFQARLVEGGEAEGWRPVAALDVPRRSSFPTESEMNRRFVIANYKSCFQQYVSEIGRSIATIEKVVRMRIELGTFRIARRSAGGPEICGWNDLAMQATKAGRQGTGRVDERIPFGVIMNLLRTLNTDTEHFEPTSAGYTSSVKPWYELILFVGKFRLESRLKVKAVAGGEGRHRRAGIGSAGTVESFHAYHREITQHVLEISTLCPEKKHDWRLFVSSEADQQEALPINNLLISRQLSLAPFNDMDLDSYLREVDTSPGGVMAVRVYPRLRLSDNFGAVDRVIGKTTWVFGIVGTDYRIEVSLFHVWSRDGTGRLSTDARPCISGGVSLYCRDWDDELGIERDVLTHPRAYDDFVGVMFPTVEAAGTTDRVEGLFHCVRLVQDVLESASTEADAST